MAVPAPAENRLVAPSSTLPLESAALRASAKGGIARVVLEQAFANHHSDPLRVTYTLPLPADAAVSGFRFRIGDRVIAGEIDRKRAARERYDDAIAHGHTAALLEQERSSLFTQEIGNVPAGARVVCEIVIDQPLRWLDEGAWEWRFPLAAAPRYLGQAGRVADASKVALDVTQTFSPRASLMLDIADALAAHRSPESPSHPLQTSAQVGGFHVELGGGNRAELDRDLVVRWPVAELEPSLSAFAERRGATTHALLTLVPPRPETNPVAVPRDLIILLDTSGSMGGTPLDQARRVSMALVDGLSDADSIELIEFSSAPRRFTAHPIRATKPNKAKALAWLAALRAGGATEMRDGILEALNPLRVDGQRQVVLITDGLIGFEEEIVQAIVERLPKGSRVHTVGVGSSVNRSLTGPAARAGRGVEVVIGLGEDPERAVRRILARTEAPLVVDVMIGGAALESCASAKTPDLYAGAPVIIAAKVRPEGGEIIARGRTPAGLWEERVRVSPIDVKESAIATLYARESVEDLEMCLAAGADKGTIDRKIEVLGVDYGIATRLTSWVAIDKTASVDPLAPTRREHVPQMLPHGMSVEGLGLRAPMAAPAPLGGVRPMTMPLNQMAPAQRASRPLGRSSSDSFGEGGGSEPRNEAKRDTGRAPPPARSAPPPPAQKSFERDAMGADDSYEEEDARTMERPRYASEPAPEAPPPPPAPGGAPMRRPRPIVRGAFTGASVVLNPARIVSRSGRVITIDILASMEIDWDPTTFGFVVLEGGIEARAVVDLTKTTRQASLVHGQIARLVIVLADDTSAAITEIVFARWAFAVV